MPDTKKIKMASPEPEKQIIIPTDVNEFTQCQECMGSLVGRKIVNGREKGYGRFTHHSKLKPVYMDVESCMATHWECPHCGYIFPRFS